MSLSNRMSKSNWIQEHSRVYQRSCDVAALLLYSRVSDTRDDVIS